MNQTRLLSFFTAWILPFAVLAVIIAIVILIKKHKSPKNYTAEYFLNFPQTNFKFSQKDGYAFENFIKDLLKKMGFSFVAHPGQTSDGCGNKNDHNIDLIFEKDSIPLLIQCKCHSNKIWSESIRITSAALTYGTSFIDGCIALLITNNFPLTNQDEMSRYKVNFINRDQLSAIYQLSTQVNKYCLTLTVSPSADDALQTDNFKYIKVNDELRIKLNPHSKNDTFRVEIYDNAIKLRNNKINNSLICNYIDKTVFLGLSNLFGFFTEPVYLDGTILNISNDTCLIRILLKSETEKPQNDYAELLEKLKPKNCHQSKLLKINKVIKTIMTPNRTIYLYSYYSVLHAVSEICKTDLNLTLSDKNFYINHLNKELDAAKNLMQQYSFQALYPIENSKNQSLREEYTKNIINYFCETFPYAPNVKSEIIEMYECKNFEEYLKCMVYSTQYGWDLAFEEES